MTVKQLSVFLENREGRLQQIFNILKEANVNVVSVSIAETSDYGIVRMIVSDVDGALAALKAQNITAKVVDVLAVNISHEVGSLSTLLNAIADAGINIKYMYGLSTGDTGASIAFKTDDIPGTEKALEPLDVQYYTPESLENVEGFLVHGGVWRHRAVGVNDDGHVGTGGARYDGVGQHAHVGDESHELDALER